MAVRGRAEPKNHYHILLQCIFIELSPPNLVFVICPGHIVESTKGIEIKLGL